MREIFLDEVHDDFNNQMEIFFQEGIVSGYAKQLYVLDGVYIDVFHIKPKCDLKIISSKMLNHVMFSTFIKGQMGCVHDKKNYHFTQNSAYIMSTNQEHGTSYFKKNIEFSYLALIADKSFIEPYLKDSARDDLNTIAYKFNNENFSDLKKIPFDPELVSTFTGKSCGLDNSSKKLYFASKALSFMDKCFGYNEVKIPHEEIKYLLLAKEYILDNIHEDLTLNALSRVAKTNVKNLQSNFKAYFGKTVFGYIYEKRMERAKELLLSRNHTIFEVAQKTGYSHQGNFTNAFYRHYKVLPKEVKKY